VGITKDLVKFCIESCYEDLPDTVVDKAKYFTLDFVGVASRGSITESSRVMYELVRELGKSHKGAAIIGTEMRAVAQYAALANGTSSHAIEMDDVNNEASLHPAVANLPVAWALAELNNTDGRKFIEAIVLGYEVTIRLGKALGPAEHYRRGFHPTATCGAFGATVVAGKVLGLSESQLVNALGIVGSMASGTMECLSEDAWTKKMNPGWSAHNGIIASLMAKKGFRAPSTIIEGHHGFLHMGSDTPKPQKVTEGLGLSYEIVKTSIKPHACCRYKQGPIDAILKIVRENDIKPQDVKSVTLGILKTGIPFVVEPKAVKYSPKSLIEAQFSMPFGAAVALLNGKAGLDEYVPENWESPKVKKMMERVTCVEDKEIEKDFPEKWPATAKIVTRDGRSFSAKIDYPKGDPANPLSWNELIEKFHELSKGVFSKKRRSEVIKRIEHLEKENDLKDLSSKLLKDLRT
jgi:2-methylcitrate dehydratase PrpD